MVRVISVSKSSTTVLNSIKLRQDNNIVISQYQLGNIIRTVHEISNRLALVAGRSNLLIFCLQEFSQLNLTQ